MRCLSDPKRAPNHDRRPRYCRHGRCQHRRRSVPNGRLALSLTANHESRLIHQGHNGKTERLAQLHETSGFVGSVCRHRAGKELAFIAPHPNNLPVEASKSRYLRAAVPFTHLEKTALVKHRANDLAHLKRHATVPGHNLQQRLLAAINRVITLNNRRQLIHVIRHVGKEALYLLDAGTLVVRAVVHRPVLGVHLPTTQLILGFFLTHSPLDHGRARRNDLCGAFRHDREV